MESILECRQVVFRIETNLGDREYACNKSFPHSVLNGFTHLYCFAGVGDFMLADVYKTNILQIRKFAVEAMNFSDSNR